MSVGWFMILDLTTSAGVPMMAPTRLKKNIIKIIKYTIEIPVLPNRCKLHRIAAHPAQADDSECVSGLSFMVVCSRIEVLT